MASIKVKFRISTSKDNEGILFIQVIYNRQVRQIKTSYRIHLHEWDEKNSRIRVNQASGERIEYLRVVEEALIRMSEEVQSSVRYLEEKVTPYTCDDILQAYHSYTTRCLYPFMRQTIEHLKQIGKTRTSETYTCTLNSFMRFQKNMDISLDQIDSTLMLAYEAWLKEQGICMNSVSFYMRILRAVYNRGVEKEITPQRYPFKHVYTGIEKTLKRAVTLKTIKQVKQADLLMFPSLDYARDMFMLSFYTRGMSFVDMAYLKKADLNNGILSYRRKKTGQQLFIRWEECMQEIVDKYLCISSSPYLLPIIKNPGDNPRKQYRNAILSVNKNLKSLSRKMGLSTVLTTYVARHSWASIAKSKNIPVSVISEGMGHDSEMTTQIYLASLDTAVVDRANRLIMKDL
ncbi:tyrosine-type recombinase/integrase [Dysgonomonas sp.]